MNETPAQEALAEYNKLYQQSINDPESFWGDQANQYLEWFTPYKRVLEGDFERGDVRWFTEGKLNVCYNCLDKHLKTRADQTALIWDGDEPGLSRSLTYREVVVEVSKIANVLKAIGVKKGDVVTIYMPMVAELAMVMLACARIGAVHSVIFAGFSAESVKGRINDCQSRFVIASDQGKRGGKVLKLKETIDEALLGCPDVEKVLLFKRTGGDINFVEGRDVWAEDLLNKVRPVCPCEPMDSEDPLFILYTSGSTGKPKGVLHTTAGYLLYATITTKWSFALEVRCFSCPFSVRRTQDEFNAWTTGRRYLRLRGRLRLDHRPLLCRLRPLVEWDHDGDV